MKQLLTVYLASLAFNLFAQPDTEIYVFDLIESDSGYTIKNPVNITYQNPGYDNQPHFTPEGELLYVSTRQSQTDVARVELKEYSWSWLTATPGSEYSPTPIPDGSGFSAINLEADGTQLLWKYPYDFSDPTILVPDLKIGYHCWFDLNTIFAFVLGEPSTLQICDLENGENKIIDENIGRSLHRIPGEAKISYISKAGDTWTIYSYDPESAKGEVLVNTLEGSEDMCWSPNKVIFMGKGDELYSYSPGVDEEWKKVTLKASSMFEEETVLKSITRLAISPDGKKIAIVVAR